MSKVKMDLSEAQPWAWYYKPDGDKLSLPCDKYSQSHYLALGFTLNPPVNPIPKPTQPLEDKYFDAKYDTKVTTKAVEVSEGEVFTCDVCGESFDSNWRLSVHSRYHKRTKGRLKKKKI